MSENSNIHHMQIRSN